MHTHLEMNKYKNVHIYIYICALQVIIRQHILHSTQQCENIRVATAATHGDRDRRLWRLNQEPGNN